MKTCPGCEGTGGCAPDRVVLFDVAQRSDSGPRHRVRCPSPKVRFGCGSAPTKWRRYSLVRIAGCAATAFKRSEVIFDTLTRGRGDRMRRREFIALGMSAASSVALPLFIPEMRWYRFL